MVGCRGRRSRNRVRIICDENDNSYEKEEVPLQFVKHFKQFLGNPSSAVDLALSDDLFSTVLTNADAEEMIKEVSEKEIMEAMFDIGDNKASGPEGFSSVFFKKAWNVVGKDVCDGIKEFFSNGQMLGELNATLITLVPKIQNPLKVSDFSPIACYNDLYKFGFHSKMMGWIMQCVKTAGFTTCINGERHGFFKGRRGLRQGDPISPYLFTLVMEMLTLLLKERSGIVMDSDIIMDARMILSRNSVSGLFPNMNKSTLFFGSLNNIEKGQLKNVMKFKEGSLPSRYLGVPLVTKRLGVNYCQILIDKIKGRTKDWKCKSLSYAGRLLLIATILESMSAYWASVFKLPKFVIKEVNGILKRFLWSNGDSAKEKAKLAWKHYNPSDSWNWKCLLDVRDKIAHRLQFGIGDGKRIHMWTDKWHSSGLLINQISYRDLNEFEVMKSVTPRLREDVPDKVMWVTDDDSLEVRMDEDKGACSLASDAFVSWLSDLSVRELLLNDWVAYAEESLEIGSLPDASVLKVSDFSCI
ncbi:RNA-directed DNA polymerase, eukaryota, reverse transcriptase zinc-binding domain protein [Tanacetum coccineum]|uniref:RNA-directed DNA polymerase, eukaryota, reverse transcriptase zinc-binding domain protein n=1 Tax=Tanacetum coccineum TaxID=301880 RepID=A0ABQ5GS52_9ASTR